MKRKKIIFLSGIVGSKKLLHLPLMQLIITQVLHSPFYKGDIRVKK